MNRDFHKESHDQAPKLLGDIIRTHRDKVELRLANIREIDELVNKIEISQSSKDEIENWRLVSLVDKTHNAVQVLLVGDSLSNGRPSITSTIVKIDFERGIALTKNQSVYKLGTRGLGEPPESDLSCICAAMHAWGNGAMLGVPMVN